MDLNTDIESLGLENDINRLQYIDEQVISQKIVDFFFGENNGQCRNDVKWQYHDLVGIKLGFQGAPLSDEDRKKSKAIKINEIYVGKKHLNRTYTVLDGSYAAFLSDALHHHLGDPCWFLPSKGLHRPTVYEGQLAAVLMLIEEKWDALYEFTISALDLSWMADYNHHHSIVIYGDKEASRARMLCNERRRWQDKILMCNYNPKNIEE